MKIEIKLDDPKFCDGCPCCHVEGPCDDDVCEMNHWIDCHRTVSGYKIIRPHACIDAYGE